MKISACPDCNCTGGFHSQHCQQLQCAGCAKPGDQHAYHCKAGGAGVQQGTAKTTPPPRPAPDMCCGGTCQRELCFIHGPSK